MYPRRSLCVVVVALLAVVTSPLAASSPDAPAEGVPVLTAYDIVTTLSFREQLLADMGFELRGWESSADSIVQHPLAVTGPGAPAFSSGAPWNLSFEAPGGRLGGFRGGRVKHLGGFDMVSADEVISLTGFEVRPGEGFQTLDVYDAEGRRIFLGDYLHNDFDVATGKLHIFNVDLRFADEFVGRVDRPELAGVTVGLMTLTGQVDLPPGFVQEGTCPDNWNGNVDVALIEMGSVGQVIRSGGQVVAVPSARLKNVGTADVPWYTKFTGFFPPYNNDQHPFLVWSAYKVKDGAMVQLGVSDVKHAFLTINVNCTGCSADSHILGLGCEDVYGQGTNTSNNSLGPRNEINPFRGIWSHCDEGGSNVISHFDQDGNCNQDFFGSGENGFSHGLTIEEAELADPDADYYFHAWYVVREDKDIFNTMGWRKMNPVFTTFWSFNLTTSLQEGSPIDAWIDPTSPPPGTMNTSERYLDGHLQVGVSTQTLADGRVRFDYGVLNHDYDRQVETFTLPIDPGVTVSATGYSDGDTDPANDWQVTVGSDSIVWQAPSDDDALDWGLMRSFSFEAYATVAPVEAMLTPLDVGGGPESIDTLSAAPDPSVVFIDGFESGDTSAWD